MDKWLHSVKQSGMGVDKSESFPSGLRDKQHYWEIYEHLMLSISDPVLHLTMEDLNDCKPRVTGFLQ